MVNATKKILLLLASCKYGKSRNWSTQRPDQVNEDKCGFEAYRVRALGALCSLPFKKKPAAEERRETHLSNKEKEKLIEYYIETETAGARKRVEDTEAVIRQQQEDTEAAENAGLKTRDAENTYHEVMGAIGDSLSDMACSDYGDDRQDEDHAVTEQGQLSEDEEPGWVMGTITKTEQQCMERFWQNRMKRVGWTQRRWEEAADYFRERDNKYGTSETRVPAVDQPPTDGDAAAHARKTFGQLMEYLEIVP